VLPSCLLPSQCRDKTDVKEQPASTAYWLNVSAGTVERPVSDDRCQGFVGYVANTSIFNSQYNRLPVIIYISLANFIVRVTKPSIKDKSFEKRADIHT
jgi:hypothetical protein